MADSTDGRPDHMLATRPYGSLESFLSNAKRNLHSAIISQQRVTIVLGDASDDLDSIASSLLYAYFRSSSNSSTPLTNRSVNRHLPTYQYPPLYIPVVNSHAQDLRDRPEVLRVLKFIELKPESLITLDDIEVEPPAGLNPDNTSRLSPQNTRIMLMGQNKLTGRLSPAFDNCVAGFMDNTCDQQITPSPNINDPRISVKTAACISLVVNRYSMLWYRLSWGTGGDSGDDADTDHDMSLTTEDTYLRPMWDHQIAELAISPILLATNNLSDQEITTKEDMKAVYYLEERIGNLEARWNRDSFFQDITHHGC